jgi:cytochrome b involved in lipid metabolism
MPLSEVARHCVLEDCWVAVNGKVYDVTEFMDRHPGGPKVIRSWAGKDASKMFNEIHAAVRIQQYLRPEAFMGDLGVDENLMSDSFWHTLRHGRIREIQDTLQRLVSTDGNATHEEIKSTCGVPYSLPEKNFNQAVKCKLQSMETQNRMGLDMEGNVKTQEIKALVDRFLAESKLQRELAVKPAGGIPIAELARHNKPHDCWIAVNGVVYDLTDFLAQHSSQRNVLLAWAGRDASGMWNKIPGRFPSSTWMDQYMLPD